MIDALLRKSGARFQPPLLKSPGDSGERTAPLGVAAGLEPYAPALDASRVRHLLRRTGLGARHADVQFYQGQTADQAVTAIIDEAIARPLPEEPSWANTPPPNRDPNSPEFQQYVNDNVEWIQEYRYGWIEGLHGGGLRERLTLFWHDHFVTSIDVYFLAAFAYRYATTLRTHALGNFRDLVYDIGIDPAMLIYLNGTQNEVGAANENYGRELLELFTMSPNNLSGETNYTEDDIQEIARCLTGWKADFFTLNVTFNPFFHDSGSKTFFGQTGNFGYDDVIDVLFAERGVETAQYICEKLYREFVYDGADPAIVTEMAQILVDSNFEIAPVLSTLFKSAHFFDEQVIGARIKSPIELTNGLLIETGVVWPQSVDMWALATFISAILDQLIMDPPNVAGWPGHHTWISTTSLPLRWVVPEIVLTSGGGSTLLDMRPLAEALHDPSDPKAAFHLPTKMAEHFIAIPLDELDLQDPDDDFAGDLVNNPIPAEFENGPAHVLTLAKIFLAGTPWYEWFLYQPGAEIKVLLFMRYLGLIPEYQLT